MPSLPRSITVSSRASPTSTISGSAGPPRCAPPTSPSRARPTDAATRRSPWRAGISDLAIDPGAGRIGSEDRERALEDQPSEPGRDGQAQDGGDIAADDDRPVTLDEAETEDADRDAERDVADDRDGQHEGEPEDHAGKPDQSARACVGEQMKTWLRHPLEPLDPRLCAPDDPLEVGPLEALGGKPARQPELVAPDHHLRRDRRDDDPADDGDARRHGQAVRDAEQKEKDAESAIAHGRDELAEQDSVALPIAGDGGEDF